MRITPPPPPRTGLPKRWKSTARLMFRCLRRDVRCFRGELGQWWVRFPGARFCAVFNVEPYYCFPVFWRRSSTLLGKLLKKVSQVLGTLLLLRMKNSRGRRYFYLFWNWIIMVDRILLRKFNWNDRIFFYMDGGMKMKFAWIVILWEQERARSVWVWDIEVDEYLIRYMKENYYLDQVFEMVNERRMCEGFGSLILHRIIPLSHSHPLHYDSSWWSHLLSIIFFELYKMFG